MRTPSTFALAAMAVAGLTMAGCSTDNISTAPSDNTLYQTAVKNQNVSPTSSIWHVVASEKFNPGVDSVCPPLTGSRYTLTFSQNALSSATTITISERDSKVVDVQLGPDGTKFGAPVTLTVNYTGTPNDPDSPYFTGFAPKVRRFDPSTSGWTDVPGTDNPATKTYTAQLTGFSRYAMTDGMQSGVDTGHTSKVQ
jgi:hypothetical protein